MVRQGVPQGLGAKKDSEQVTISMGFYKRLCR